MLVGKVAQWLGIGPEEALRAGKQPLRVKARDLLCYFANRELGMSNVELARILNIGQSSISRSVQRGEKIPAQAKSPNGYWIYILVQK